MTHRTILKKTGAATALDFDAVVEQFYEPLCRFAIRLSGNLMDAGDLVYDTFGALHLKGGQIRDTNRLRSWLFTTLYRRFLKGNRDMVSRPGVGDEVPPHFFRVLSTPAL